MSTMSMSRLQGSPPFPGSRPPLLNFCFYEQFDLNNRIKFGIWSMDVTRVCKSTANIKTIQKQNYTASAGSRQIST